MNQTTHFFNLGWGWLCKHCSAEAAEKKLRNQPPALAKWIEEEDFCGLKCSKCGIDEYVKKPDKLAADGRG
jgi:hypothetical protein